MRVFEDIDFNKETYSCDMFECLPQKAKSLFFNVLYRLAIDKDERIFEFSKYWMNEYAECKSPIEKIFMFAFNVVNEIRSEELGHGSIGITIITQKEILTNNHKYFVDFYIVFESINGYQDVVVECDGYEFHQKTKEQIARDNEREYEIKKAGFDVLRFIGSQIYNTPFKCANDVFDYLVSKQEMGVDYGG